MSRITQKGQVTIPKEIRDVLNIGTNDIGEFTIREGSVIFTVKKGTILKAHRKKTDRSIDFGKARNKMETEVASDVVKEMK
jgi:AbrB family looped-hinge helix DNA binding protein